MLKINLLSVLYRELINYCGKSFKLFLIFKVNIIVFLILTSKIRINFELFIQYLKLTFVLFRSDFKICPWLVLQICFDLFKSFAFCVRNNAIKYRRYTNKICSKCCAVIEFLATCINRSRCSRNNLLTHSDLASTPKYNEKH